MIDRRNLQGRTLSAQRGAATLIVVMVLFFVVSLVAAYASRNIIFEQRTGANLARSTQAQEVAEAGIRWTLSMLNAGRIDESCVASSDPSDDSFRERYLDIIPATGEIIPRTYGTPATPLASSCVWDPALLDWTCSCPRSGPPSLTPAPSMEVAPAFRAELFRSTSGVVVLHVAACTRYDTACIDTSGSATSLGELGEGRARAQATLYLAGMSMTLPQAALTAAGPVNVAGLAVSNSRVGDSGLTIHAAGAVSGSIVANTQAGTALDVSQTFVENESSLQPVALSGARPVSARDRFAALMFGMPSVAVRDQPTSVRLDCSGPCDGDTIYAAALQHPGRPIWVDGGANISALPPGSIGSATQPVLLIVDGDLAITAAGTVIQGLVFVRPSDPAAGWALPAAGKVEGAVVVDSGVTGTGSFEIEYRGELLRRMRTTAGSFMIVPGGWRDSIP